MAQSISGAPLGMLPGSRTLVANRDAGACQFKSQINGALPCKLHQKQHLEFCTVYLRTRGSGVRVSPGAPHY